MKCASDVVLFLKAIREKSPLLERLVLYATKNDCQRDPNRPTELEDFLITFVKKMPHLVVLCLAGIQFDSNAVEVLKRQFTEEVLPDRPAFWFHLGENLPEANGPSVPRIHGIEIVNPIDWFDTPPKF